MEGIAAGVHLIDRERDRVGAINPALHLKEEQVAVGIDRFDAVARSRATWAGRPTCLPACSCSCNSANCVALKRWVRSTNARAIGFYTKVSALNWNQGSGQSADASSQSTGFRCPRLLRSRRLSKRDLRASTSSSGKRQCSRRSERCQETSHEKLLPEMAMCRLAPAAFVAAITERAPSLIQRCSISSEGA